MPQDSRVAVAGASGFVGQNLVAALIAQGTDVLALCRNPSAVEWPIEGPGELSVEAVDVADTGELERVIEQHESTYAYYLIHSMGGGIDGRNDFVEMDRRLARSFAKAASATQLDHVVYLGGHLPDSAELSDHLRSRADVASTFRRQGLTVTELRAGVVIDLESAAFRMLSAIIERQSVLLIPPQFKNLSHPIAVSDAVACLLAARQLPAKRRDETFDIGCEDPCRYADLITWYAQERGDDPVMIDIPWAPREIIVPYVAGLTGEDFGLVWALAGSWGVDLPMHNESFYDIFPHLPRTPARDAVGQALEASGRRTQIHPSRSARVAS